MAADALDSQAPLRSRRLELRVGRAHVAGAHVLDRRRERTRDVAHLFLKTAVLVKELVARRIRLVMA